MRMTFGWAIALALVPATMAAAHEAAVVSRLDPARVELRRDDATPVSVWISADTQLGEGDHLARAWTSDTRVTLPLAADRRAYVILQDADGETTVAAERELPLAQGSNFRDVGGYETADGHTVRWGKVFRSGAMPLLSDADYALIGQLRLDSVVDLRSLEERSIASDLVDDRTGALFIANDYSMQALFTGLREQGGENIYQGMEKLLAPQYRSLFRRIIADEGAVVYHCSAGQDRTGIATALLYDTLGVDRETILKDYHLSTALRRPQWEMPQIDPADYPGNFIAQHYARRGKEEREQVAPLYTASGQSHLAQFFAYLDAEYGGSEGYLRRELGLSEAEIARLRSVMLD